MAAHFIPSNHFKDGCAVVTGAASGIGRATAITFARDGCVRLFLGDLSLDGLEETKRIIKTQYQNADVRIAKTDISDEAIVEKFYQDAIAAFGRIDYAANVAGFAQTANGIVAATLSDYEMSYKVNQRGTWLCERAQLRQMLKQEPLPGYDCRGSIVNVTSLCATSSIPGLTAYSASKGGLLGISKTDALDYGPEKIRVNCVAPGNTITPMVYRAMGEEHMKMYAASTPLRRNAEPEDIANAIVWLSSPYAAYVTGISLPVDGGLNLNTGPSTY